MSRAKYYDEMKALARQTRQKYGLTSSRVLRSDLRRIYRAEEIEIHLWPYKLRKLRGAYFNDEHGTTVMLAKGLPEDPMVFTMGHELKHHLVDADLALSYCDSSNESSMIEIGAEVFAAELIYPEDDFRRDMQSMGVRAGGCGGSDLVRLKHETRTTLSYAGLAKRAVFQGFGSSAALSHIRWKKLEEEMYGVPLYKLIRRSKRS